MKLSKGWVGEPFIPPFCKEAFLSPQQKGIYQQFIRSIMMSNTGLTVKSLEMFEKCMYVCKLMAFINLFVVGVRNESNSTSAILFKASEGSGLKALEGILELGR